MIALGSDHGGFELKQEIINFLQEKGLAYKDVGCYDSTRCDYADFGEAVAVAVANGEAERGIVICGTGIGISISANKVPGIRCALCGDVYSAKYTRYHNDSNVLALGGRVIGVGLALEIVDAWLSHDFQGGRHLNRVNKITALEKKYGCGGKCNG
ncbi:MAG: ribose 5-phosphate isomerase B [Christensenellales bacterium]|jgi:ribose 5-phosphate isomerase B